MISLPSLLNIIFHLNNYYKAQYALTFSLACDTFKVNLTKEIDWDIQRVAVETRKVVMVTLAKEEYYGA